MTANELTAEFMAWVKEKDLLRQIDEEECRRLAEAFGAGYRVAIKLMLGVF